MSSDPHTRKSYAEAMNQWANSPAGQRSFAYRSRVSLWQPDPFAHPLTRFFGYVWRLAFLALLGFVVYIVLLRFHLGGRTFLRQWENGLAQYLVASEVKVSNLKWQGQTVNSTLVTAQGKPQAAYSSLEAGSVRFTVPFRMMWESEWTLRRVSMGHLVVNFRAGAMAPDTSSIPALTNPLLDSPLPGLSLDAPAEGSTAPASLLEAPASSPRNEPDLRLMRDGFGVNPHLSELKIQGVDAVRFEATWGASAAAYGSLQGKGFSAAQENDGTWTLEIESGTLEQNWLKDLQFTGLKARLVEGKLFFDNTSLTYQGGKALLNGHVVLGGMPELNLTLLLEEFPLSQFLTAPYTDIVSLKASGSIQITGSTNRSSGITMKGELTVLDGSISNLGVQRALVNISSRVRLREFDLTGGTINFETRPGALKVTSFELQSRDDIVLNGQFSVEHGLVEGECQIGIAPDLLIKVHPQVLERLLPERDSWRWVAVPLHGEVTKLTEEIEARLLKENAEAPPQEKQR